MVYPGCEAVKHCSIRMENQLRSLEQLLPFEPQTCARADIQDWRGSGPHDPLAKNHSGNGLLNTLIL